MKTSSRFWISNAVSYGMIAALLVIIVRAAVYLLDVSPTNISFGMLNFVYNLIVLSICLYLGAIAWRKKSETGNLSYIQGLLICISISFVTVFFIHVYDLIFYTLIAPDYIANLLEPQLTAISGNPAIPPMQKLQMMEKMQKLSSPFYSTGLNALTSFGISVIVSLILAIFTVRNRPVVIENTEN
ncbi:MAG: DUF4199 domain-containing protein [Tannerella sp.]|jgi:hypothetical protein|nr:DUF4199 domain-containing protein [Tannerella sp.]